MAEKNLIICNIINLKDLKSNEDRIKNIFLKEFKEDSKFSLIINDENDLELFNYLTINNFYLIPYLSNETLQKENKVINFEENIKIEELIIDNNTIVFIGNKENLNCQINLSKKYNKNIILINF